MAASESQWTIDEIAQRAGMTARNIRAHQSRGLLDPPAVRGRTGYYGPRHLARIELIMELQADGFNLEAIRRYLEAQEATGVEGEPLKFLRVLNRSYRSEEPQSVSAEQLQADWGPDAATLLEEGIGLGLVRPRDDGDFEYPSPGLVAAARQVAELGIPLQRQLELVKTMQGPLTTLAAAFVEIYIEQVWLPFKQAGTPADRWPDVREALQRMRPLAGEVLWSVFAQAMDDATEQALSHELEPSR